MGKFPSAKRRKQVKQGKTQTRIVKTPALSEM
jgi:hypothetical protein